ncbi:MAG TPA: hypothetical protein VER79_09935 [Candidatus Limnocylindrales bacterium]|nr:hypothetical protein [Candidatus Limnocylindrales bacterium]
METGSLIIVLVIAALGAAVLALPFVRRHGSSEASQREKERTVLVNDYARVVSSLRDLEEDHNTGKLSDAAYEVEKTRLSEQGVILLESLDKEGLLPASRRNGAPPTPGSVPVTADAADQALDEALEAAIARYASAKVKG